jgi:predicted negative regulator of RcsB-dependent stress response
MTSPITDPTTPVSQPKAESFLDWFSINSRMVSIGAAVVVVAALGFWFVKRTQMNETINSDRQLLMAKQSLQVNEQLALADLKKVVDKYGDKPAGAEAGMLIATTQLDKGDYKAAVATLRDLAAKAGSASVTQVRTLLGDALTQAGQPAEAAAEYEKAAAGTDMVLEKAQIQAKEARAYAAAGKTAEARKLFEALANQSDFAAVSAEAKVRLGELSVGGKP